jgi:hypothetical protein
VTAEAAPRSDSRLPRVRSSSAVDRSRGAGR